MRICIVTTHEETIFIPKGINKFTSEFDDKIDIICVPGFSSFKRLIYYFLSLYFVELISIILNKCLNIFKKSLISKNIIYIKNINSEKFEKLISNKNYDLIISYSCPQIFKKEILNFLKKNKIDIVNFHPGILPKYKGLCLNYYALNNEEKFVGISFHKITEKIDGGEIMTTFKIPIDIDDTIYSLYKKIYLSENSLKFVLNCIKNYSSIKNKKIMVREDYKYNSYPMFKEIIKYRLKKF